MRRALKWSYNLVVQNLWWKILSLAIAVALWAVVRSEPELATFPVAPVEYKNLPDDLEFSAEPVSSVKLELRGPSGELSGLGGNQGVNPAVILDLAGVSAGRRTFPVGYGNVKLPRGVRLEGSIPAEVRLEFDRRLERIVPIEVRTTGEGQNGYHVASIDVEPKTVGIVGPAGHVNAVVSAATDRLDVSSLVGSSKFRVNAFVQDPLVRFQSPPQITVSITMRR